MARRVYGNFGDFAAFGSYDGIFDSVKSIASSVIPSHTVVGKLLGGDYKGATSDATKLIAGSRSPGTATPAGPVPVVGGGMFGGSPSWLMPVAIGGGALLLLMMLKKGRR